MSILNIKRIYEKPSKADGIRIFIDRLWARGINKKDAHLDYWLKSLAPSGELRKWFNHESEKFLEFTKRYKEELKSQNVEIDKVLGILKNHNVTLIYAAKNEKINHAVVLKEYIEKYKKN